MCSVNSVYICVVFSDVKNIMLCGIESHVCVQSTVLYICAVFSDVKNIMLYGIESHVCVQSTVYISVLYFQMLKI